MNPIDLIRRDLGADWERLWRGRARAVSVRLEETLSVFSGYKIYVVMGDTHQFDFPCLPNGSMAYYAANGAKAVRLTRTGKEIQSILAEEWPSFAQSNPVCLASLLLRFLDGDVRTSHHVLANADDLRAMCLRPATYRLNEEALAKALPDVGVTSSFLEGSQVVIRAITLLGWRHDKRNLGIEILTIHENGQVAMAERQVLAKKIFDKVPALRY